MNQFDVQEQQAVSKKPKGLKKVTTTIGKGISNLLFADNKLDKAYMGVTPMLLGIQEDISTPALKKYRYIDKKDLEEEDFRGFMHKTNNRVQKSTIADSAAVENFLDFASKRAMKVNVMDKDKTALKNKEFYDFLKIHMDVIIKHIAKLQMIFSTDNVRSYLHVDKLNRYFIPQDKDFLEVINSKILGELIQLDNSTKAFLDHLKKTGGEKYKEYLQSQMEQRFPNGYRGEEQEK